MIEESEIEIFGLLQGRVSDASPLSLGLVLGMGLGNFVNPSSVIFYHQRKRYKSAMHQNSSVNRTWY